MMMAFRAGVFSGLRYPQPSEFSFNGYIFFCSFYVSPNHDGRCVSREFCMYHRDDIIITSTDAGGTE